MTPKEFCYWLQGFFELQGKLTGKVELTPEQAAMIRDHLQYVFTHLTAEQFAQMTKTLPAPLSPLVSPIVSPMYPFDPITVTC